MNPVITSGKRKTKAAAYLDLPAQEAPIIQKEKVGLMSANNSQKDGISLGSKNADLKNQRDTVISNINE